ncbi:MAG: N-acetylmuramoyl-L-alanine amidase, partial [Mogibacterium sp.]|nr:N-acetylmuramoyl-L-alanine amidase [Mogibacterium sp.]
MIMKNQAVILFFTKRKKRKKILVLPNVRIYCTGRIKMSGPIAFILAMMISAAVAVGDADLSGIIEEAERIEAEEKEKAEAAEYLIAIDPGHQEKGNFGQEPVGPGASQTKTKVAGGTRGRSTGVPEYQLTLDVSLKLRDILEDKGYKVLMIRETNDVDITNAERAKMANEAEADVFVRVHANGSESSSANGAMTICQTSSNPYNSELYEKSRSLSQKVLDAYTEATGIRKERVWETDTMSGINWCTVPVTIIEVGYMTNPEEDEKMQESDFQDLMAEGIAEGIENYLADLSDDGSAESDEEAAALP